MKKTLIALAAVAVSSAAMAQVTLSGKFGVAYTNGEGTVSGGAITSSTAKASGFGVTDGDVVFAATEDIGSGMKAGANMAVKVRGRGPSGVVDGRDATVFLQGGFGRVVLGAVESGNGIIGRASAGAPTIGQDNGVTLDGAANIDMASWSLPVGDFTATLMLVDSIGAPGANGMESTAALQDATLLGLSYAAGPISAGLDITNFGKNGITAGTASDTRTRLSASYDLGMAKVGFGYQTKENVAGTADKQTMLGVSMPLGNLTLGATYALRDNDSAALDATGFEVGANYAFSKRTSLQAAYLNQEMDVGGAKATNMRVRLMHAF